MGIFKHFLCMRKNIANKLITLKQAKNIKRIKDFDKNLLKKKIQ